MRIRPTCAGLSALVGLLLPAVAVLGQEPAQGRSADAVQEVLVAQRTGDSLFGETRPRTMPDTSATTARDTDILFPADRSSPASPTNTRTGPSPRIVGPPKVHAAPAPSARAGPVSVSTDTAGPFRHLPATEAEPAKLEPTAPKEALRDASTAGIALPGSAPVPAAEDGPPPSAPGKEVEIAFLHGGRQMMDAGTVADLLATSYLPGCLRRHGIALHTEVLDDGTDRVYVVAARFEQACGGRWIEYRPAEALVTVDLDMEEVLAPALKAAVASADGEPADVTAATAMSASVTQDASIESEAPVEPIVSADRPEAERPVPEDVQDPPLDEAGAAEADANAEIADEDAEIDLIIELTDSDGQLLQGRSGRLRFTDDTDSPLFDTRDLGSGRIGVPMDAISDKMRDGDRTMLRLRLDVDGRQQIDIALEAPQSDEQQPKLVIRLAPQSAIQSLSLVPGEDRHE